MELYFLATGEYQQLKFFETQMQTIRYEHKGVDKNGKPIKEAKYGMLQPINLYRFICSKEHMPIVIKSLGLPKAKEDDNYNMFNSRAWALKKMMRAKSIPKPDASVPIIPMNLQNLAIKGIGIKEDAELTDEHGQTYEGI